MPVKIRLARHGKKGFAFYHIVAADSRAPRDGKFIEKLGVYNPNSNPASIELNFEKALTWLQNGAQPTDTCRAILTTKGVMYKNHLLKGVRKGAFSLEEAEVRFTAWKDQRDQKILSSVNSAVAKLEAENKKRMDAELKAKEAKALAIAKKNAQSVEEESTSTDEETSEN